MSISCDGFMERADKRVIRFVKQRGGHAQ
eukprot:COSAG02_NODE_17273_length_1016_cov_1.400218_2_plen_28_part_01